MCENGVNLVFPAAFVVNGGQVRETRRYRLACNCYSTPPTMPTCRSEHLDWCTAVTGIPVYVEYAVPAGQ